MKAVIPVAGLGKRFYPWTLQNSKELIPVPDPKNPENIVSVVDLVVREAYEAGCNDILLITALGKSGIKDHLTRQQLVGNIPKNVRLHYTDQYGAKGLGDAISCAKSFVGYEDFVVLLGDDFYDTSPLKEMIEIYNSTKLSEKLGALIAIQKTQKELLKRYGVVKIKSNSENIIIIDGIIEKPEEPPSDYIVPGRYILSNKIFFELENLQPGKNNEIQLTDAIQKLIEKDYKVRGVEVKGKRYDAGEPAGWLQVIEDLKNCQKK